MELKPSPSSCIELQTRTGRAPNNTLGKHTTSLVSLGIEVNGYYRLSFRVAQAKGGYGGPLSVVRGSSRGESAHDAAPYGDPSGDREDTRERRGCPPENK